MMGAWGISIGSRAPALEVGVAHVGPPDEFRGQPGSAAHALYVLRARKQELLDSSVEASSRFPTFRFAPPHCKKLTTKWSAFMRLVVDGPTWERSSEYSDCVERTGVVRGKDVASPDADDRKRLRVPLYRFSIWAAGYPGSLSSMRRIFASPQPLDAGYVWGMSDFAASWSLSRKRFIDEISELIFGSAELAHSSESLSIGEMALHMAGTEISFGCQLSGQALEARGERLRTAATQGVVDDAPFPHGHRDHP